MVPPSVVRTMCYLRRLKSIDPGPQVLECLTRVPFFHLGSMSAIGLERGLVARETILVAVHKPRVSCSRKRLKLCHHSQVVAFIAIIVPNYASRRASPN